MSAFSVPLNSSSDELMVKRSQFLSFVYPFSDVEAIRSFLKEDKERFRDATHHVHAFRVGSPQNYSEGYTDDGEPSGTAGRPILSLLQAKNYSNVLVVVVRYYGGTPLGAGGLVRAYAGSSDGALKKARWEVFTPRSRISLIFPYPLYNMVKRELPLFKAQLQEESFHDKVFLEIELPIDQVPPLIMRLRDLTSGNCLKREEGIYELI